jgi:hypothetical protein
MTAHQFLIEKGITNMGAQFTAFNIQIWLEKYAEEVLKIAAEKARTEEKYNSSHFG